MRNCLAIVDFPSVKKFVFGTDRAREIRGASALLERLNVVDLPRSLEKEFEGRIRPVFFSGGAGLFTVESATPAELDAALERIDDKIHSASAGGLHLDWSVVELGTGAEAFAAANRRAHILLAGRKGIAKRPRPRERLGVFDECHSCSSPGVSVRWTEDGQEEWICGTCKAKRDNRREGRSWRDLAERLGLQGHPEEHRPDDFSWLAARSIRKGYAGLVYMDGDAMGRVIKSIAHPDHYRVFSKVVDESLRAAVGKVIGAYREKWRNRREDRLPADVLLLGGDDLVMVTTADLALPMAIGISAEFRSATASEFSAKGMKIEGLDQKGLTVSAGVAFFKDRQPFRVVLEQAESLLRSAKRARAEAKADEGFVDFADVSQSRFVALEDVRRIGQGIGSGTELTCWPRSASRAEAFLESARSVVEAGVTKGRINQLAAVAGRQLNAGFETRRLIARAKRAEQREALLRFFESNGMGENPPWAFEGRIRRTAIADLATLFPHLEANP